MDRMEATGVPKHCWKLVTHVAHRIYYQCILRYCSSWRVGDVASRPGMLSLFVCVLVGLFCISGVFSCHAIYQALWFAFEVFADVIKCTGLNSTTTTKWSGYRLQFTLSACIYVSSFVCQWSPAARTIQNGLFPYLDRIITIIKCIDYNKNIERHTAHTISRPNNIWPRPVCFNSLGCEIICWDYVNVLKSTV